MSMFGAYAFRHCPMQGKETAKFWHSGHSEIWRSKQSANYLAGFLDNEFVVSTSKQRRTFAMPSPIFCLGPLLFLSSLSRISLQHCCPLWHTGRQTVSAQAHTHTHTHRHTPATIYFYKPSFTRATVSWRYTHTHTYTRAHCTFPPHVNTKKGRIYAALAKTSSGLDEDICALLKRMHCGQRVNGW